MKKKCTNAILLLLIVSAFFALVCVKIQAASKPATFYKYYVKKTKLTVRSSTGYRKIQLNGKKIAVKKGAKAYVVKVVKPGKNVIKTVDVTGEKCNIIAYIDKRCPTFNFTDGETYCNELTVTAYDDVKLFSVTLNGKKVGKSFTITEKGADCVFSLSGYEKQSEFVLYLKKNNAYKLNGQTVTDDMLYWSRIVPDNCEICLK